MKIYFPVFYSVFLFIEGRRIKAINSTSIGHAATINPIKKGWKENYFPRRISPQNTIISFWQN